MSNTDDTMNTYCGTYVIYWECNTRRMCQCPARPLFSLSSNRGPPQTSARLVAHAHAIARIVQHACALCDLLMCARYVRTYVVFRSLLFSFNVAGLLAFFIMLYSLRWHRMSIILTASTTM